MHIKKIFNNNVVMTESADGLEMIVRGKGLAFNKRCGEEINPECIEKTYTLNNQPELYIKFQDIMTQVDDIFLEITDDIVAMAAKAGIALSDSIYINLPDHLSTMMQRLREGIILHHTMLSDIKAFYPKEYEVGVQAIRLVEKTFGDPIPKDEAGFIATHLINASLDMKRPLADAMLDILTTIQNVLNEEMEGELNESSVYYDRFLIHLKYFAQRIVQGTVSPSSDELCPIMAHKYPKAYHIATTISQTVESCYDYNVGEEELVYLTIHLAKLLNDQTSL